jgi:hypothetical protein
MPKHLAMVKMAKNMPAPNTRALKVTKTIGIKSNDVDESQAV